MRGHGVGDRPGDGPAVEAVAAMLGNEPQRAGLLGIADQVAFGDLALQAQLLPQVRGRRPQVGRYGQPLGQPFRPPDLVPVGGDTLLGGADGRRQHGLAVKGAVVIERPEQAGHGAWYSRGLVAGAAGRLVGKSDVVASAH